MKWLSASKRKLEKETLYEIPERWLFLHYYEAMNILFRIENSLRVFVYIILKNIHKDDWLNCNIFDETGNQKTINTISKQRINQAKAFGYLGHYISCPIMHLTSGELISLILSDNHWPHFKQFFKATKELIKTKLDEISTIRNSLAHFRPIKKDDIEVIKQNSKQVFILIEKCFKNIFFQSNMVPTNTLDSWYTSLSTLGNEFCDFSFYQSQDEKWIKIKIDYKCKILGFREINETTIYHSVLSITSPAILYYIPEISKHITFISERGPGYFFSDIEAPKFIKSINLVFGKKLLEENFEVIKNSFEELLNILSKEIEEITNDNLARGKFIELIRVVSTRPRAESEFWNPHESKFYNPITDEDPPEYWGSIYPQEDFIAGADSYPWMPEDISEYEPPLKLQINFQPFNDTCKMGNDQIISPLQSSSPYW